jgi:hypothetical protein
VVLVRMRQHQQVDASHEERQVRADAAQRQLRIRPAVDEHRRSARRLDQDGVALADIERGDVQASIWLRAERDRQQHGDEADADRQRAKDAAEHRLGDDAVGPARGFEWVRVRGA